MASGARTGGCYCGAVRYEVQGRLGPAVNCHCRFCRRVHGAAFATVALVRSDEIRIEGAALREYPSGEGSRFFCGECGGRLFNRPASDPGLTMLAIATLDEEPAESPVMHVNVESKAPWYTIRDELPQYPGLPPGAGG